MEKELIRFPDFDDIVFEIRNKEYGAYLLRKTYSRNVILSLLIGNLLLATAVIIPYFSARAMENRHMRAERQVEIKMENLDQPNEIYVPPPAAPPPAEEIIQQAKYVPPVVVDSVKPEDNVQLMTADEAQTEIKDSEVTEFIEEVKEEVHEVEAEPEPFIVVEEMPSFPGGDAELLGFIARNTNYPAVAQENNIQGRVTVKFCVTSKGGVDKVSIFRGIDPELDAEAIRVVKSLPPFNPGKQGGRPVPVWYSVPITFQIK